MNEKTNNPVAKHARKYNKAAVHKDRKKAMKKGDRKHKGRYEEIGNVDEVFTTTAISNFFKKSGDKKKYDKVVSAIKKGNYTVAKASQMFDLDGHILQSMVAEWSCNTTEKTRRVKGGDKRKGYMKEKQVEEKKGLWDRIHAKRKRGEKPAKPGDKDYPKTLDVGEGLKQARKNVGSDSCWDGYKAKGTKMKNGKEVPDCKKESAQDRLDRMAKKHGLGKPNKAADDYLAKMMKKYGAKDMADLKKKMGMKEGKKDRKVIPAPKSDMSKRMARGKRNDPMNKIRAKSYPKESVNEDLQELTQRELDMMAKRKKSNLVKRGKAKPEPKKPQQKDKSAGRTTAKQSGDDHLVMQLRKAQDVKGNMDIKVTPTGKTVKLPIKMIDKLLATHDKLQKPDEKRKFRVLVTKELRKRAK